VLPTRDLFDKNGANAGTRRDLFGSLLIAPPSKPRRQRVLRSVSRQFRRDADPVKRTLHLAVCCDTGWGIASGGVYPAHQRRLRSVNRSRGASCKSHLARYFQMLIRLPQQTTRCSRRVVSHRGGEWPTGAALDTRQKPLMVPLLMATGFPVVDCGGRADGPGPADPDPARRTRLGSGS
jgi:hypothetical protein